MGRQRGVTARTARREAFTTHQSKFIFMAAIDTLLFWVPILFGLWILATYIGATLALRSYFEDESFVTGDFVRIDDGSDPDR